MIAYKYTGVPDLWLPDPNPPYGAKPGRVIGRRTTAAGVQINQNKGGNFREYDLTYDFLEEAYLIGGYDFENDAQASSKLHFWSETTSGTGTGSTAVSTVSPYSGVNCLECAVDTDSVGGFYMMRDSRDYIAVDSSKPYWFNFAGILGSGAGKMVVVIHCYDASKSILTGITVKNIAAPAGWTKYPTLINAVGGSAPAFTAATAFVKISVRAYSASGANIGSVKYDEISFKDWQGNELVKNGDFEVALQSLYNIHHNVAKEGSVTIEYVDPWGVSHQIKFQDNTLPFECDGNGFWAGTIRQREDL